jgi:hypothetical protein
MTNKNVQQQPTSEVDANKHLFLQQACFLFRVCFAGKAIIVKRVLTMETQIITLHAPRKSKSP